ncbi:hypothetical protein B0T16DRAFT_450532 [Cercophora newfieldiana]|uniref:T6SS Phospholipase effector Tle1-like catalytic domain-containing protein n=1 Tax=Cercophora newfieldiana TaxID=92897 RepID=A0AA39YLG5_9PEZI|nr:hypothetical protein B0T16DRAFT_450532 [Cercophora newfieldiana]
MTGQKKGKRIIACCDGTWMSSIGDNSGPQSNVTRLSRAFKRSCDDGSTQVILYDSGVGSSASIIDQVMGGAFGMGLEQNIREVYNFICNNFVPESNKPGEEYPGDDIILIGFSRGAFTARSVADLIGTFGLLTNDGLDHFSAIFNDYENISDHKRTNYLVELPAYDRTKHGDNRADWVKLRKTTYLNFLIEKGYTSSKQPPIKALAVFDTVGTLGIPPAPLLGIHGSAKQYKFSDTILSPRVQHAFQALALDEPRFAFRPALWEKPSPDSPTILKQVWFPGSHANIGGGWYDQQMADITLAWMVDQLAGVGVKFRSEVLVGIFQKEGEFAVAHPFPHVPASLWGHGWGLLWYVKQRWPVPGLLGGLFRKTPEKWAVDAVYAGPEKPVRDKKDCADAVHDLSKADAAAGRSWGLGQIRFPDSVMQCMSGSWVRTPGETVRVNPETNKDIPKKWLLNTSERIHSCVRVRLACGGLGVDDHEVWRCDALTGNPTNGVRWKLRQVEAMELPGHECLESQESVSGDLSVYNVKSEDWQWSWWLDEDCKGAKKEDGTWVSGVRVLPEEPLSGYWERYLLGLHSGKGEKDVWKYARDHAIEVLG